MGPSIPPDALPLAEEVAELLHAVSGRIRAAARPQLEPLGLTPAQARALRLIGRSDGQLRMSDLAGQLRIAPRSATSVVEDLVERGLVCRCPLPDDRRAVMVEPTANGSALLRRLGARRRAVAAQVVSALNPAELAQLRDLLRRIDAA
jgi:DNA-binding MarR family transcriptional regulator